MKNAAINWGNYWSGKAEQVTASVTYKTPAGSGLLEAPCPPAGLRNRGPESV